METTTQRHKPVSLGEQILAALLRQGLEVNLPMTELWVGKEYIEITQIRGRINVRLRREP